MRAALGAWVVLVSGCIPDQEFGPQGSFGGGGGFGSVTSRQFGPEAAPSLDDLSKGQRGALKQGCADRYGYNTRKYELCVRGEQHSEDALVAGCTQRYKGDPAKIRRCLGY
jgi:hypothetical protein